MSKPPDIDTRFDRVERRLIDLAMIFHVEVEGEYGCNGPMCPGVQRLVERLRELKGVGRYDYKDSSQEPPIEAVLGLAVAAREWVSRGCTRRDFMALCEVAWDRAHDDLSSPEHPRKDGSYGWPIGK